MELEIDFVACAGFFFERFGDLSNGLQEFLGRPIKMKLTLRFGSVDNHVEFFLHRLELLVSISICVGYGSPNCIFAIPEDNPSEISSSILRASAASFTLSPSIFNVVKPIGVFGYS